MKVICRKIISPATNEDLGDSSPWLKVGNEYIVLAIVLGPRFGISIVIQTEEDDEIGFMSANGFEFTDQHIPSSWIIEINEPYGEKVISMLPASWSYDSFFEDLDDQKPEAIALFNEEVEKIYQEELQQ
jgi:hypothetical protein